MDPDHPLDGDDVLGPVDGIFLTLEAHLRLLRTEVAGA
jgi:hypothetical protein